MRSRTTDADYRRDRGLFALRDIAAGLDFCEHTTGAITGARTEII